MWPLNPPRVPLITYITDPQTSSESDNLVKSEPKIQQCAQEVFAKKPESTEGVSPRVVIHSGDSFKGNPAPSSADSSTEKTMTSARHIFGYAQVGRYDSTTGSRLKEDTPPVAEDKTFMQPKPTVGTKYVNMDGSLTDAFFDEPDDLPEQ